MDQIAQKRLDQWEADKKAEHARLTDRLERDSKRREDLWARLCDGDYWYTANGDRIPIRDMTPRHAGNAVAMLARRRVELADRFAEYDVVAKTMMVDRPLDVQEWFEGLPAVLALRARAADKPTWRERRRDRKSHKEWEARDRRVRQIVPADARWWEA